MWPQGPVWCKKQRHSLNCYDNEYIVFLTSHIGNTSHLKRFTSYWGSTSCRLVFSSCTAQTELAVKHAMYKGCNDYLLFWAALLSFVQHKWNNKWINCSCTLIFSIHILPCVLHFKAYILCHHNVISKTAEFSCRMLFYSSLVNSDLLLTRAIQHN